MIIKRTALILIFIAGIALASINFYAMFIYDLPWITEKWGHEKGGPWLFGVIGLALSGWALGELVLSRK